MLLIVKSSKQSLVFDLPRGDGEVVSLWHLFLNGIVLLSLSFTLLVLIIDGAASTARVVPFAAAAATAMARLAFLCRIPQALQSD